VRSTGYTIQHERVDTTNNIEKGYHNGNHIDSQDHNSHIASCFYSGKKRATLKQFAHLRILVVLYVYSVHKTH